MANNMNKKKYYQTKGEESTGLIRYLALAEFPSFDGLPREYAGKPAAFKESVGQYLYGNFILVPFGTNLVRCIHSCFISSETTFTRICQFIVKKASIFYASNI
jgi:hypothetical protein